MNETNDKKDQRKSGHMRPKWIASALLCVGVLSLCLSILVNFDAIFGKREATIITTSDLRDVINISELSAAEFIYNGIAQGYVDENKTEVKCNIKYYATIKAGIDMKDVTFTIDGKKKIVKSKLPEIRIMSNIVDSKKLDFLPEDSDIKLQEAILICEEDANQEAEKTPKLKETAEAGLKANIEGLLYPILHKEGYKIVWES